MSHVPVLLAESIAALDPHPGGIYVDATGGEGGHTAEIVARLAPGDAVVVIDRDGAAVRALVERFRDSPVRVTAVHGNFRDLDAILDGLGIGTIAGVLFDLGTSSMQMDDPSRGFSARRDGPLDERMDTSQGETAADLLVRIGEKDLRDLLLSLANERWAARISRFVVTQRAKEPIVRTKQLADLVAAAIPKAAHPPNTHPATRTMMALRMAVNDEIGALRAGLEQGVRRLAPGGRVAVISFCSTEDREAKQSLGRFSGRCTCPRDLPECRCGSAQLVKTLSKRPITPGAQELATNPRARSGRLRAAERTAA